MNLRLSLLLPIVAAGTLSATPESWKEDACDPKHPFAYAFLPMLDFEKASIETTLRGFIAIGDSAPGYRAQKEDASHLPSEWGMNLNVATCEDTTKSSDVIEKKGGLIHRSISLLSPTKDTPSLEIEWVYGPKVKASTLVSIEQCIKQLKKSAQLKPDPTPHFNWVSIPLKARAELLSALIFEEMTFHDQTLEECLRQLSDRTSDILGHGVSFSIRDYPGSKVDSNRRISLKCKEITFREILKYLADASGAKIEITESGVSVTYGKPPEAKP